MDCCSVDELLRNGDAARTGKFKTTVFAEFFESHRRDWRSWQDKECVRWL